MNVVTYRLDPAAPTAGFAKVAARLADGEGEAHVYCMRFCGGGSHGPQRAGFGALLVVVSGSGWVAGADGRRQTVSFGQAAYIENGELYSMGSDQDMTALVVQIETMTPRAPMWSMLI